MVTKAPACSRASGSHRPELRAWAMYDWANSAFQTTVITAVFPPFFSDYAAAGLSPADATARFAWATTIAVTITARDRSDPRRDRRYPRVEEDAARRVDGRRRRRRRC